MGVDRQTLEQRLVLARQERSDGEHEESSDCCIARHQEDREPGDPSEQAQAHGFRQELGGNALISRANCFQDTDLPRSFAHLHQKDEENHLRHEDDREQASHPSDLEDRPARRCREDGGAARNQDVGYLPDGLRLRP